MTPALSTSELNEIRDGLGPSLPFLEGQDMFLTGGTGFFGKWLVQALLHVEPYRSARNRITILTRDAAASRNQLPWLAHAAIDLIEGDIRKFEFPQRRFPLVIHAAVPASAALLANDPGEMLATNIFGAERALAFARHCDAKTFLLTSSGAVYGRQPLDLGHVAETYGGAPSSLDPGAAYAEGKRCAEMMSVIAGEQHGFEVKIARCYGYAAPYLPLDTHFAVGNFILNCLRKEDITIKSDGSSYRSYMYGTDLVIWLMRILSHGESSRAYNVGAEMPMSIKEIAYLVRRIAGEEVPGLTKEDCRVNVALPEAPGKLGERYIPAVQRAREELGLELRVSAEEAIRRTFRFYLQNENR